MSHSRKVALVAGIFFALTFVHIPSLLLYDSVLNDAGYIAAGGDDGSLRLGALLELVVIIANVGTAVTLFSVLRHVSEGMAIGYVALRIFESTIIAVGTISLLSILTLRQDLGGADAAVLGISGDLLLAVHEWTFLLGPGFCAGLGNGLLLGYMLYRSALVPRKMALIGVIGGPLSAIGCVFVLFGQWDQDSSTQLLLTLGEIAWEASLTVYLIWKGFRAVPVLDEVDVAAGRPA